MLLHFLFLEIGRDLHMAHCESDHIANRDIQSTPMVLHTITQQHSRRWYALQPCILLAKHPQSTELYLLVKQDTEFWTFTRKWVPISQIPAISLRVGIMSVKP